MYRLICKNRVGTEIFNHQYDTKEKAVESLEYELERDAGNGYSYEYDLQRPDGWVSIPWRQRVELL